MVTLTNPNNVLEEPNRWVGLSFDDKPTTAHNGDEFIEMDTSKQYMYDEESADWVEVTASGGGGGGESDFYVIRFSVDGEENVSCDKSWDEIKNYVAENGEGSVIATVNGSCSTVDFTYDGDGLVSLGCQVFRVGFTDPSTAILSVNTVGYFPDGDDSTELFFITDSFDLTIHEGA